MDVSGPVCNIVKRRRVFTRTPMASRRMSVAFSDTPPTIHHVPEQEDEEEDHLHFIRESTERTRLERLVHVAYPRKLSTFKQMVESWRQNETNVLFGNLGRQPYLLNYFLDLCFGYNESVKIQCQWKLPSGYQTNDDDEPLDFLILVEPYFGYSIQKPPHVKHLVVLTSHLDLYIPDPLNFHVLHLSRRLPLPQTMLRNCTVFKPPIFHLRPTFLEHVRAVLLDVTDSPSAHEAYLRILTGREICNTLPVQLELSERDRNIIRHSVLVTKKRIEERSHSSDLAANIYWLPFL